jgi:hypothetical protein
MEKILTCTKCRKTFKVCGIRRGAREELQGVPCPFCGESMQVMWPAGTVFTTIPETRVSKL